MKHIFSQPYGQYTRIDYSKELSWCNEHGCHIDYDASADRLTAAFPDDETAIMFKLKFGK